MLHLVAFVVGKFETTGVAFPLTLVADLAERLRLTVSYDAADRNGTHVLVDRAYVEGNLGELVKDEDLSRYIL